MKLLTATLIALGTICVPVSVEAQTRTFLEDCEQYEVTETYTPGQIVDGSYSRGRVNYTRNRVVLWWSISSRESLSSSLWFISATTLSSTAISTTAISATTATNRSASGTMSR